MCYYCHNDSIICCILEFVVCLCLNLAPALLLSFGEHCRILRLRRILDHHAYGTSSAVTANACVASSALTASACGTSASALTASACGTRARNSV